VMRHRKHSFRSILPNNKSKRESMAQVALPEAVPRAQGAGSMDHSTWIFLFLGIFRGTSVALDTQFGTSPPANGIFEGNGGQA
jgi:hypothetical protein